MSEILELVRRRLVFIVLCAIVAVAVPAGLATASPDSYRATARLFVGTSAQDVTAANQGNLAAQSRVRTYALMAVGPELLARAAQRSGVSITGGELAQRISVSTPPDTVLLDIAATAGSAQEAAALSDAVAQELVALVSDAERPLRGGNPSLGLLILQPADAGTAKVPVLQPTLLAAYGVGGLVLGVVIAILVPGRFRLFKRRDRSGDETATAPPAAEEKGLGETELGVQTRSEKRPDVSPAVVDEPPRAEQSSLDLAHPLTNGWESRTDPRGYVSPFASASPAAVSGRRHRREGDEWRFGDSAEQPVVNGDRPHRRRDETSRP